MNDQEIIEEIAEAQKKFLGEVREIEKERDEKLKLIKKDIDLRRINKLSEDVKSKI